MTTIHGRLDRLGDAGLVSLVTPKETLIYWPSWPKISTEPEDAVSRFLHFQSLKRPKMAGRPAPDGKRRIFQRFPNAIDSAPRIART